MNNGRVPATGAYVPSAEAESDSLSYDPSKFSDKLSLPSLLAQTNSDAGTLRPIQPWTQLMPCLTKTVQQNDPVDLQSELL